MSHRGPSSINCSIGQTLSNDTLQCAVSAGTIIYAQRNAVAIAEIKLREIPMQMLLGAMLVHALHAALENTK
jgi:hypothetical protein